MTTCSDSFWFWFMRPFAESLGALALITSVTLVVGALLWIYIWWNGIKKK